MTASENATIVGVARNAKLSAVVITDQGEVIYCLEISSWPDPVDGHRVEATGKLEESGDFRVRVDPDGAISQGTEGDITVLRGCTVRVIE